MLARAGYKGDLVPFFENCSENCPFDRLRERCTHGLHFGAHEETRAMLLHVNRIERRAVNAARSLLPNHAVEPRLGGHRFSGRVNDVELTLRLFQNFSDSADGGPWTDVLLPPAPGISLELRPQDPIESSGTGSRSASLR